MASRFRRPDLVRGFASGATKRDCHWTARFMVCARRRAEGSPKLDAQQMKIAAISGHASLREVERYTKAADQERMARNALARTNSEIKTVKLREV